jgi:hypothetical protein
MAMAGFLVVALAYSILAALFLADALILFGIVTPNLWFDCGSFWWVSAYAFGNYQAFIGVGVVMWLIGYAIRQVTRLLSSGRSA